MGKTFDNSKPLDSDDFYFSDEFGNKYYSELDYYSLDAIEEREYQAELERIFQQRDL